MVDTDFTYIRTIVQERSAIQLSPEKKYLVASRLAPLVRQEGVADLSALVQRLRQRPHTPLHAQVVDAMTTNETSFFRDHHPFEALRTHILPALIERNRRTRRLSIWSNACSSGQEAYSTAILLREHFPELKTWSIRILATDISPSMLERCAGGRYSQLEVNRGMPIQLLLKYFDKQGTSWQVKPELRRMVEVRPLNLIERWPVLPKMDLIFLRNVLIYFDRPTKERILQRMESVLHPDGILMLGGAETILNMKTAFEHQRQGRTLYYRRINSRPA